MKKFLSISGIALLALCLFAFSACAHGTEGTDSTESEKIAHADSIAKESPAQATLFFVGDAMQHQDQLDRAKELGTGGKYSYTGCFDLIAPQVKEADYAVVNLEVPLGGGKGGYTGFPCFSAPDEFAVALKQAGFDLFLTANNHTLDRRDAGLRRTLQVLDSLKVDHTGTFYDANERTALVPLIKKINGIKVAFLNYTYGTNGISATQGAEVALIDRKKMASEIALAKENGAEIIVVAVHWGIEYELKERAEQRDLVDFLLAQGTDIVMGGHPHVIQPMKLVDNPTTGKKSLIVYSLGNFISNMKTDDTRGGASVTVSIQRDGKGDAHVESAFYDTFYSAKPYASENYKVIPSQQAALIPDAQKVWWNTFNNRARRVFEKENVNVPAR